MSRADDAVRTMRSVARDPRVQGMASAIPRSMSTAWRSGVRLGGHVLIDEVVISAMKDPRLMPHGDDYARAAADLAAARAVYAERGWLREPENYHHAPGPTRWETTPERAMGVRFRHATFPSAFAIDDDDPGGAKWQAHESNHTAHVWLLQHRGPQRPWLVCAHGFGMGVPMMDFRAFKASELHRRLGLNLAMVCLPLHGPRRSGRRSGDGFMSIDLLDAVHGLAQSAWDVRRVIATLRADGATDIGLFGISLGGYVASLVASLEPDLACVIAGIPATDIPDLYRRHSPPYIRRRSYETGALGPVADEVHRVVSPLAMTPKVPFDRRFIFAGTGDRMATARQAERLWEHWDRPAAAWYPGGHLGFFFSAPVGAFVIAALQSSGLVPAGAVSGGPMSGGPGPVSGGPGPVSGGPVSRTL